MNQKKKLERKGLKTGGEGGTHWPNGLILIQGKYVGEVEGKSQAGGGVGGRVKCLDQVGGFKEKLGAGPDVAYVWGGGWLGGGERHPQGAAMF